MKIVGQKKENPSSCLGFRGGPFQSQRGGHSNLFGRNRFFILGLLGMVLQAQSPIIKPTEPKHGIVGRACKITECLPIFNPGALRKTNPMFKKFFLFFAPSSKNYVTQAFLTKAPHLGIPNGFREAGKESL